MTVKEHLSELHKRLGEHHVAKAKHHRAMASHMRKLGGFSKADEAQEDAAGILETLASMHEEMSAEHGDLAAHHLDCCKTLAASMKAAGMSDADLDKVMPLPSGMSMVAPTAPNIRSVPRGGQPQPLARANVPIEFSHLVKVSDDE